MSNVIIRNIKISKVLAGAGDAIGTLSACRLSLPSNVVFIVGIQAASKVWIDHTELSSDRDHDKDYYDGLLDVTHGSFAITLSFNILHDHWKASLVGHSDSNGSEDAALRVTYHHVRLSQPLVPLQLCPYLFNAELLLQLELASP